MGKSAETTRMLDLAKREGLQKREFTSYEKPIGSVARAGVVVAGGLPGDRDTGTNNGGARGCAALCERHQDAHSTENGGTRRGYEGTGAGGALARRSLQERGVAAGGAKRLPGSLHGDYRREAKREEPSG